MKTDGCGICGEDDESKHRAAEQLGSLNHQWSTTGALIPVQRNGSTRPPRPQQPIMVVGALDLALRRLLVDKGILTDADLASLLSPGLGNDGDRGTGATPPP